VLRHVFPAAGIPVIQLSIDATQPPAFHFELGRRLAPLRREGILLAGSGGLVHHLGRFQSGDQAPAQDWARRAEQRLEELLASAARDELVNVAALGADILEGIPTPDHYLPLLYILGASRGNGRILCRGIEGGSISLLSARFDD
jgi:4,5-DOPA dioxygenase extradiol